LAVQNIWLMLFSAHFNFFSQPFMFHLLYDGRSLKLMKMKVSAAGNLFIKTLAIKY
jgi:hypothetical protein